MTAQQAYWRERGWRDAPATAGVSGPAGERLAQQPSTGASNKKSE